MKDRGCCCLCPSRVGVFLIFTLQILVIAALTAVYFVEDKDYVSWPDEEKHYFLVAAGISIVLLFPYVWVCLRKSSTRARIALLVTNVINWVVWLLAYRAFSFLLIMRLQGSLYHHDVDPKVNVYFYIPGFIFGCICALFTWNGLYNFYDQKVKEKQELNP